MDNSLLALVASLFVCGISAAAFAIVRCKDHRARATGGAVFTLCIALFLLVYSPIERHLFASFPLAPRTLVACVAIMAVTGLSWAHRYASAIPIAASLALLFGTVSGPSPSPFSGWGLLALPPMLVGILMVQALTLGQRVRVIALLASLGVLSVLMLPGYMSAIDDAGWQAARNAPAGETLLHRELVYASAYLVLSFGMILFAWLCGAGRGNDARRGGRQ